MAYEHDRITGNAQDYRRVPETRGSGAGLLAAVLLAVVVGAGIYAFSSGNDGAVAPADNTTIINEPAAPAPAADPAIPVTPDATLPPADVPAPAPDAVEPAVPAPAPADPAQPAPAN
ncbi:hypothetical protein [Neotabrizicola sp. VNH66]|uniref:hypothetical protein n=1 Tax=Neotabrizicola sp. VNH66 TaxID=3400918 RepID=UPI003C00BC8D